MNIEEAKIDFVRRIGVDYEFPITRTLVTFSWIDSDGSTVWSSITKQEFKEIQDSLKNKTPCKMLGYKVGDRFVIIGDEVYGNKRGRIITLEEDDGTDIPRFSGLAGGINYYRIKNIDKINEPQPDSEGWIKWYGGECPVEKGTLLDIKYRDGEEWKQIPALINLNIPRIATNWGIDNVGTDIIAYRLSQHEQPEEPTSPTWNGEGLPPVGVECEIKRAMEWQVAKILFISENHVVFNCKNVESVFNTYACVFRPIPIRSSEEIEREKAIAEMLIMTSVDEMMATKLYDAGYRKVNKTPVAKTFLTRRLSRRVIMEVKHHETTSNRKVSRPSKASTFTLFTWLLRNSKKSRVSRIPV